MHAIFQPVTGPVPVKTEDLFKTLREIDQEFSYSSVKTGAPCPEASEVYARLELEALIMGKVKPAMEENY
jgi:hypothetical protein